MQLVAHHLNAQSPPRRSAGGKSAISESQFLGRPHRPPPFPQPEDPKRKRRTSPRRGPNPPPALVTHLVKHAQRCVTTFRFSPATDTNKWTSKTHKICCSSPQRCVTTVPPGRRSGSADAWPPSRANSQTGLLAHSRAIAAEPPSEAKANFAQPQSAQQKIGFVPSFCPTPHRLEAAQPQVREPIGGYIHFGTNPDPAV